MALGQLTFGPVEEQVVDPTVNDDSSEGFGVGTIWINTATDDIFIAADVSVGAAVWVGPLTSTAHAAVTLGADVEILLGLTGQELTLDPQTANLIFAGPASGGDADPTFRALIEDDIPADIMRDAEHTAIGDGSPHHAAVTLGGGSDPALSLVGQELTLADVLTPAEHTAIGAGAPHHASFVQADADLLYEALGDIAVHTAIAGAHHAKYTGAEAIAAVEAANPLDLANALLVDTINEHTPAAGVTIEGVTLEDGYIELVELGADPTQIANSIVLYAKDDGGVSALYYRQDDGTVVGPLGGGGGAADVYEDGGLVKADATVLDFKGGFDVAVDGVGVDITLDVDESPLSGLAKLAGRAGGQTLIGGIAADEDAVLQATAHATRTNSLVTLSVDGTRAVAGDAWMELAATQQTFGADITAIQFLGAPIDFKNVLGGIPVRFTDANVGGPSVEFATGVLNVNQDIDIAGHVAVGEVAPNAYRVFNVCKDFPFASSALYGIFIDVHATGTTGTLNTVTGLGFEAYTGSVAGVTFKIAQGIYGYAFKEGSNDIYMLAGAAMGIGTISGATGDITGEAVALWLRSVRTSVTPKAPLTRGIHVDDFSPWGGAGDAVYGILVDELDADTAPTRRAIQYGNVGSPLWYVDQDGNMVLRSYTNAGRPAPGVAGRVIYNSDDGGLNVDDGARWRGPAGGWINT